MTASEAQALVARIPDDLRDRAAALEAFITYGPDYERIVATHLHDAARGGDLAGYWLECAEAAHAHLAERRFIARARRAL